MSQNPYANPYPQQYAQPYPPGYGTTPPARTSIMAVLSLVLSLLCCIPGLSILGVIFGGLALLGIAMSGGKVKGVGLAITGLILGIIVSVVTIASAFLAMGWMSQMAVATEDVIEGIRDDDPAAVSAAFLPGAQAQITSERLSEFADVMADDLGAYDSAPDGIMEWWEGYAAFGNNQAQAQSVQRGQGRYGSNIMPVPMKFDGGWEMVLVVFSQSTSQTSTQSSMIPLFQDFGIVRDDGSIEWLIAGNDGGGSLPAPSIGGDENPDAENPDAEEPAAEEPEAPAPAPTGGRNRKP